MLSRARGCVKEQLHAAGATTAKFALLRSGSCVFERDEDVLAFQIGVVGQQLVDAGASSKPTEHRADGHAGVADAGQAAHPVWIDGDSLLGHRARVRRPAARYLACGANARRNRPKSSLIPAHPHYFGN